MKKKYAFFVLKLAFIVGIFVLLFRPEWFGIPPERYKGVTPLSIIEFIRQLDTTQVLLWLGFACTVKLAGIFCGIMRWKLLLRGQRLSMPLWYLAKCWFMGRAIGLFLPGTVGLDGYRLVESSVYTKEPIKCTTVIAVEKLIGFIALGLLVFLTLPLVVRLFEVNYAVLGVVLFGLFVFIATSFLLLLNPRVIQILASVVPIPGALRHKVDKLGSAIIAYSGHRGLLMLAVLFGLGVHLGICLMYFGTAMAVTNGQAEILDILFVSPLVIVMSVFAPTVSGVGVREGGFALILGGKYGTEAALLAGHMGLWAGEMVPFVLSVPLLLFATRPKREEFLEEVEQVREELGDAPTVSLDLPPEVVNAYRFNLLACVVAGVFGGLLGGAVAGFVEAAWHLNTLENVTDTAVWWWAPLVYGVVFSGVGLGVAAALTFVYLLFDKFPRAWVTFGLSLAGTLLILGVVVGRFRYVRDVLGEHAPTLIQNVGVLAAAVVAAAAVGAVFGLMASRIRRPVTAIASGIAAFAVILAAGFALSIVQRPVQAAVEFTPATAAGGPNILLIAVDTLRADYLDIYNPDARPDTPNISKFAGDSIVFEKNFAQSSWTKASFGTMFSGMFPEAHTATGKASALPDEITTFAETLEEAGYYTNGFSNNPNITSVFNYDQGFHQYTDLKPDLYFGATPSSEKVVLYDILRLVVQKVNARLFGGRIRITDFYQPADAVTQTALEWVDGERPESAPFFLFLHYMDPHDPFRDPERPGKGYARVQLGNPDPDVYLESFARSYTYEVEYMDEYVGKLLDGLKERGLYDDTVIVFTADHGEEFFEHGGWWHGLSLYDEQIAVPLIIKLAGNQYGGARNPHIARHVDLAPTLAQIAQATPSERWQGKSLFTQAWGAGNTDTGHSYAHLDFEGILLHALRTQDRKLINANEGNKRAFPPVSLFDLTSDPGEQKNLVGEPGTDAEVARLNQLIEEWQAYILENKAEPAATTEGMKQLEEELEALGYLGN